jgi:hypothetical protein
VCKSLGHLALAFQKHRIQLEQRTQKKNSPRENIFLEELLLIDTMSNTYGWFGKKICKNK